MVLRLITALGAALVLSACGGGNPFGNAPDCRDNPFSAPKECPTGTTPGTGTGTGSSTEIPAALRGNLVGASYNPSAGTLTAIIDQLAAGQKTVVFNRTPSLDVPGYQAFTFQENGSTRVFIAQMAASADGSMAAGVAGSGQFTEVLWGSGYVARTAFEAPTNGGLGNLSSHYAGILNTGVVVPGPGAPFDPSRPHRVQGEVLVNADFTNKKLEGGIRNRVNVDTATAMDDLFLQIGTIKDDGTFGGTVAYSDLSAARTYGGALGGKDGAAIAGAIEVKPLKTDGKLLERGVFIGTKCAPGNPPPCP